MTTYKWRCPFCGYVSGGYKSEEEAVKMKDFHTNWCKTPKLWEHLEEEKSFEDENKLVEVWV